MRKLVLSFVIILFTHSVKAQAPELINYQAVIRDTSGSVLQKKSIALELTIRQGSAGGTEVYVEQHAVVTSKHGLVNVRIGGGVPKLGSFSSIKWGSGQYFMELGVDQTASGNFRTLGSTKFVSVPYALYAANVNYNDTSSVNELQQLTVLNDTLSLSGNGGVVNLQKYLDNTDAQQIMLSGDTLLISGGNQVILPTPPTNLDNDSTNEIQLLLTNNDTLLLSRNGGVISLRKYLDNTDSQLLSILGDTLTISNGNRIVLPDHRSIDNDTTNEIQTLTISNDTIFLSQNTGSPNSIVLPAVPANLDNDSTNEFQTLTFGNDTLSLSNGNSVSLSSYTEDSTRIADADGNTRVDVEASPNEDKIRFKMAGVQYLMLDSGRIEVFNTGSSVFLGEEAGLNDDRSFNDNVFIGNRAGKSNSGGIKNTAVGKEALLKTTNGSSNTAIGSGSMHDNTVGFYNVAIGRNSLYSNKAAYSNVAIGYNAMFWHTTNGANIAIGHGVLENNTNGIRNTAIGYKSLELNTTGGENTTLGSDALRYNLVGERNVAIGHQAGISNLGSSNVLVGHNAGHTDTLGSFNTLIGTRTNVSGNSTFTNSAALGYSTVISASNQIRIGNSSVTSIGGQVGWTTISDSRFKENIQHNVVGLEFIMSLKPVTYHLNTRKIYNTMEVNDSAEDMEFESARSNKQKMIQSGFLAQEVERAAQNVGYTFSGIDAPKNENDIYGLRYAEFVVPLVKATQEQQEIISKQQERITRQDRIIEGLIKRIEALESN